MVSKKKRIEETLFLIRNASHILRQIDKTLEKTKDSITQFTYDGAESLGDKDESGGPGKRGP